MNLPILDKNGFLTIVVKDNHLYANLAYSDFSSNTSYLLTDITDLSPLKFRMDDIVFNTNFWMEYFISLGKLWKWEIIDTQWQETFKYIPFETEGVGLTGIKILVDDNQPFFKNIYKSVKEFSKDIVLRVVDSSYLRLLMQDLSNKFNYEDVLWVDLDLSHFTVHRYSKKNLSHKGLFSKEVEYKDFNSSSIDWSNEIGIIDSLNSSKLKAFISADTDSNEMVNRWANFIAHSVDSLTDPLLEDLVRAFTTVQNFSIRTEKHSLFENLSSETAIFVTGKIAKLLPRKYLLLSLIDGFELEGEIDLYIDTKESLISYGRNLAQGPKANDIHVLRSDILPECTKVLIPELRSHKANNKVVYSASITSQDFDRKDLYSINPNLDIFKLPPTNNKIIIEGIFKNGAYLNGETHHDFVSSPTSTIYTNIAIDARFRPIVYGPNIKDNRVKLQKWLNGDKK